MRGLRASVLACVAACWIVHLCLYSIPSVRADNVQLFFTNEQLGATEEDIDTLWCRDKQLWRWQARQLLPWDAAPDDMYRWKNQHVDMYTDLNEHNMLEWLSGMPHSTYSSLFDFLRIRVLYARQLAREARILSLLGRPSAVRVVPVHEYQAYNAVYGSKHTYLHVPHNREIEILAQFEHDYAEKIVYPKIMMICALLALNLCLLLRCLDRVAVHSLHPRTAGHEF
jgi:hypothetical protein